MFVNSALACPCLLFSTCPSAWNQSTCWRGHHETGVAIVNHKKLLSLMVMMMMMMIVDH
jgi:hypothetical protein